MQNPFYRLDFSEIDDFDPSLVDGYRVLYDRELCCHVRYQDKYTECRDMPQPESLTVRVLLMGEDHKPRSLKVEVFCENDLFFAYYHEATPSTFEHTKLLQQLECSFSDYAKLLIIALNNCIDAGKCRPTFTMLLDGSGKLEIVQQTEFKSVQLLNLDFGVYNDEFIRQRIQSKYHQVRRSVNALQGRQRGIQTV